MAQGSSQIEIENEIIELDCGWEEEDDRCRRARQGAAVAARVIQQNTDLLDAVATLVGLMAGVVAVFLAVARFLPGPGRIAVPAARRAQASVSAMQARLAAQKAANDDIFAILRAVS